MADKHSEPGKLILCIDDEPVILMAMAMELRKSFGREYIIETATTLGDLLELAGDYRGDGVELSCVISDWIMPGAKGEDVAAALRALSPGLPVLLMTGHAETEAAERSIGQGGPYAILRKPWRNKELVERLNELLGKR